MLVNNTKDITRIQGLDELRGLSILWVMLCHGTVLWTWMPSVFSGFGFHAVVLFFIISGFLITKILLDAKLTERYFSRFYINRVFRIWPLMLAAMLLSASLWPSQAKMAVFNLLMVNNYAYAYGLEPMTRTDVMWSLAIEEQFYLFWPVVIYFMSKNSIALVAALIVLIGLCFDSSVIYGGPGIIFKTTHGNMQYIAMGALIATQRDNIKLLLGVWLVFLALWVAKYGVLELANFRWIWYGVSFLLGLLVYVTVYKSQLVKSIFLAEIGRLCYGLYIIHFFISYAVLELFGRGVFWPGFIYVIGSAVLAVLSYRYFEVPMLNLRLEFHQSEKKRVLLFSAYGLVFLASVVYMIAILKT